MEENPFDRVEEETLPVWCAGIDGDDIELYEDVVYW